LKKEGRLEEAEGRRRGAGERALSLSLSFSLWRWIRAAVERFGSNSELGPDSDLGSGFGWWERAENK